MTNTYKRKPGPRRIATAREMQMWEDMQMVDFGPGTEPGLSKRQLWWFIEDGIEYETHDREACFECRRFHGCKIANQVSPHIEVYGVAQRPDLDDELCWALAQYPDARVREALRDNPFVPEEVKVAAALNCP